MRIAIASGKGGTGKTTVAVNLALCIPGHVRLLDCDVEEPNCHIFLKPDIKEAHPVTVPVPSVDEDTCTGCGECSAFCEYNAIACVGGCAYPFPELCHGCGGCMKICPVSAITEVPRVVGAVEAGVSGDLEFIQGRMDIGQAMSPPIIRAVKKYVLPVGTTIIDCPPGTSCPVIEAVRDADFVLLVTEPTPFGLHDLKLAVDTIRKLGLPLGVIINRCDIGDARVEKYCTEERISILLTIPDDLRIAQAYSRGVPAIRALPELAVQFEDLYKVITGTICCGEKEQCSSRRCD